MNLRLSTRSRSATQQPRLLLRSALLKVVALVGIISVVGATTTSKLGGADASKSTFEKSYHGIREGVRYVLKAFDDIRQSDDSQQRSPTQVELALVGFGRTGTTSLVSALQSPDMGYTFVHDDTLPDVHDLYGDLMRNHITMDEFVFKVGQRGFDALFLFTDEFLQWLAQPEQSHIKVILSTRDNGRKWAESWLVVAPNIDIFNKRPYIWSTTVNNIYLLFDIIYKDISTLGQPSKYKDLDTLEAAYDAHLVKVQQMIPSDRLLVYNVKEGWDPLCKFLGKDIPATKFPHVNDKVVVQMMVFVFWIITWIWPVVPIGLLYVTWMTGKFILRRLLNEPSNGENMTTAAVKKKSE